jgi:hypothetical protein
MDERPSPADIVSPPLHSVPDPRPPPSPPPAGSTEYEYTFPTSFSIGTTRTPPLVDSAQLRGHLALLRSFVILRSQLDHMDAGFPLLEDKDRRWAWFVSAAVERRARIQIVDDSIDLLSTSQVYNMVPIAEPCRYHYIDRGSFAAIRYSHGIVKMRIYQVILIQD